MVNVVFFLKVVIYIPILPLFLRVPLPSLKISFIIQKTALSRVRYGFKCDTTSFKRYGRWPT